MQAQSQNPSSWVNRLGEAKWHDGNGPVVIDLFSGCGGLSLGFHSMGFRVVLAVEIDSAAAKTYRENFPDTVVIGPGNDTNPNGDITTITGQDILSAAAIEQGQIDLIIGGPPCQGFSIIGKRRATDPRSKLYHEFVRLIQELEPKAYLFENVPGIMDIAEGSIFRNLLSSLKEIGYSTNYALINAATYDVPQIRTRLFVTGTKDNQDIKIGNGSRSEKNYYTVKDALYDLPKDLSDIPIVGPFELPYASEPISDYGRLLRRESLVVRNCVPTSHTESWKSRIEKLEPGKTDAATKHRRLNAQLPAWTLRAGTRTRTACRPIHPTMTRVITIREAARLGSFPDEFWFPDKKAPAHMLIGNSVPPLLAYHLAQQLAEQIF